MPFILMDAERAARQIVKATKRGESERIPSLPANLLTRFNGLFPATAANLLSMVNGMKDNYIGTNTIPKSQYPYELRSFCCPTIPSEFRAIAGIIGNQAREKWDLRT